MELLFEYSPLWLWVLIPFSLATAIYLYFFKAKIKTTWLKVLLSSLRFLALFILSILILNPLLRQEIEETKKPLILLVQDGSRSMLNYQDSAKIVDLLSENFKSISSELEDYDFVLLNFNKDVAQGWDNDFTGLSSDFAKMFSSVQEAYGSLKPAGMVLISDGNVNRGLNPLLVVNNLNFPIYTLAVGDTLAYADIRVEELRHNDIAYLDNSFPLKVNIRADEFAGETIQLSILKDGKLIEKKEFKIASKLDRIEADFLLEAKEVGYQEYTVQVSSAISEKNLSNNSSKLRIEVLDSRKKVLLLAAAAHPDIKTIRNSLESLNNLELDVKFLDDENANYAEYEAVILYQLPSVEGGSKESKMLSDIQELKIPTWYILGRKSRTASFNRLQNLLEVIARPDQFDEARLVFNQDFSPFSLDEEISSVLSKGPPLIVPFGNYKLQPSAEVLAYQRIGQLETQRPLWVYGTDQDRRISVTIGEGLWRLNLYNYAVEENQTALRQLVQKTIQFLTANQDKERFRLRFPKSSLEQESLVIEAELYNKSFERVTEPAVNLSLLSADGNQYSFQFSKLDQHYRLRIPYLTAGNYRFKAETKLGDESFSKEGSFTVQALNLEQREIKANHSLLKEISERSAGEFYRLDQLGELELQLKESVNFKPRMYLRELLKDLIEHKLLLVFPLLLLSLEWILRKRYGKY